MFKLFMSVEMPRRAGTHNTAVKHLIWGSDGRVINNSNKCKITLHELRGCLRFPGALPRGAQCPRSCLWSEVVC